MSHHLLSVRRRTSRMFLLALLLALLVFAAQPTEPVHAANAAEIASLTDLYNDLGGPGWNTSTNWLVGDPCLNNWYGVTCDGLGNVTEISFILNNLNGNIDQVNFSGLTNLVTLELRWDPIGGAIDGVNLTGLSNLETLDLSLNQIGGNIDGLNLTGLTGLETINLRDNQIGGNIDGFNLSGLTQLRTLYLSTNQIGGNINGLTLTGLTSLETLALYDNQIGGNIDGLNLTGLSNLNQLLLNGNQIGGNINGLNLTGLSNLSSLRLNDNQIGGNIDGLNLTGLSNLLALDLYQNQIGGNIDGLNLTGLSNLWGVRLFDNQIGGNIDGLNLTGLSNLHDLTLNNNLIGGDPSGMPAIPPLLSFLYLHNNQINGTVPDLQSVSIGYLWLCPNPAVNPSGIPAIDNFAETHDYTGWTAATGCPATNLLTVGAACNGNNLDVNITGGDALFDITGTGPTLPQNGVGTGITTLNGSGTWIGVTVTETTGDLESTNLGDFTCPALQSLTATANCNGAHLNINITAGDPNFNISADDPAAITQTQNNVPAGTHILNSSSGYGTWTNISITELGGDTEVANLANVTCSSPPPAGGGGGGGNGGGENPPTQPPQTCNLTFEYILEPTFFSTGDTLHWTSIGSNPGPDDCVDLDLSGSLPDVFQLVDFSASQGSHTHDGQYMSSFLDILPVGGQVTFIAEIVYLGEGTLVSIPMGAAMIREAPSDRPSAGEQLCFTWQYEEMIDNICFMRYPDTLPATGGEPVNKVPIWAGIVIGLLLLLSSAYFVAHRCKIH